VLDYGNLCTICIQILKYVKQKQIFVAPHRRIEEKEDQQHRMEKAFEHLYMSATGWCMFSALCCIHTRSDVIHLCTENTLNHLTVYESMLC